MARKQSQEFKAAVATMKAELRRCRCSEDCSYSVLYDYRCHHAFEREEIEAHFAQEWTDNDAHVRVYEEDFFLSDDQW